MHQIHIYQCTYVCKQVRVRVSCTLQEFARSEGIEYIETSAKNSTNVEAMFRQIAVDIRQRVENSLSGPGASGAQADGLRVGSQESAAKGCC